MKGSKIILIGPYPPPYGGMSIYVKTLMRLLEPFGVSLWAYGSDLPTSRNIFPFVAQTGRLLKLLLSRGRGTTFIESSGFFLEYPDDKVVPLWVLLKPLLGFRWIKIAHMSALPALYSQMNFKERLLFRLSMRFIDEFVAVNEELQAWLQSKTRKPVHLVNSLLPYKESAEAGAGNFLSGLALKEFDQVICSIGSFKPEYGFEHVVNAVDRLREEEGKNIGLVLIEGTSVVNEDLKSRLLAGRDWIRLVTDIPHEQVRAILKRSDLFIRPVRKESYGLSRVEALWAGTPVVATNTGETRGMRVYEPGDDEQLFVLCRETLFQGTYDETESWQAFYRKEAEANFHKLLRIFRLSDEGNHPQT